jgi:hypothetical protein
MGTSSTLSTLPTLSTLSNPDCSFCPLPPPHTHIQFFDPDYLRTIVEPMDLATIRRKIHKEKAHGGCVYKSFEHFSSDIDLMLRNCLYFNDQDSVEFEVGVWVCLLGGGGDRCMYVCRCVGV